MDPNEPVTVLEVAEPITAEIVKNALVAAGIPATLEGALQAAEPGIPAIPVKVQVHAHDAVRARKFIEEHQGKMKA